MTNQHANDARMQHACSACLGSPDIPRSLPAAASNPSRPDSQLCLLSRSSSVENEVHWFANLTPGSLWTMRTSGRSNLASSWGSFCISSIIVLHTACRRESNELHGKSYKGQEIRVHDFGGQHRRRKMRRWLKLVRND
jgi:hypothetical protein